MHDPLTAPVAPLDSEDASDVAALPVARREDGLIYRLCLLGSHLLLVAATGAGKSGAIWAIIHALAPGIRDGLVQLWVCDPKGGMELAGGQRLFTRFCHGAAADDHERAAHEHAYAASARGRRHRDAGPPGPAARRHPAARTLDR